MLMDAIHDLMKHHGDLSEEPPGTAPNPLNTAAKVLAHSDFVFMLANQLALLDLTTLRQYPPLVSPTLSEDDSMLRAFLRHTRGYHDVPRLNQYPPILSQIVAISDPNDILSYLVSPGNVGITDKRLKVANVYLGVAINWLNAFANPVDVHVNYLTNQNVINIIACGMAGKTIKPCA